MYVVGDVHGCLVELEALLAELDVAGRMFRRQADCYRDLIRPALAEAGIRIVDHDDLDPDAQARLREYFENSVLPTLTPLTFDPAHPFPFISNLSLSLAVLTRETEGGDVKFSRVRIPQNRPRLVRVGEESAYVRVEGVVEANLDLLFPNVEVVSASLFRVTRNAEVRRNEEVAEGLIEMIEDVLRAEDDPAGPAVNDESHPATFREAEDTSNDCPILRAMRMYDRGSADGLRAIDRWDGGVGWIAHPEERGRRASHAIRGEDGGVWVFDPIDAPGVDDLLADLGEVAGVAVLSDYHARDAGAIADRHGVPVSVPAWLGRIGDRVDAPIERHAGRLGDSGFLLRRCRPLPGWREAIAYRESDRMLYVADVLSTAPDFVVGEERIGVYLPGRLFPPRDLFAGFAPERIIVGHGAGVFEDAEGALARSLDGARRRLPRALVRTGWAQVRAGLEAL